MKFSNFEGLDWGHIIVNGRKEPNHMTTHPGYGQRLRLKTTSMKILTAIQPVS